ncbi:MAG: hypothetical protein DMG30_03360 [Acidobacteria bacterium]|nr:MAG: hypothetical protein DMG30_03360 [Acidobacteriota bacterium]
MRAGITLINCVAIAGPGRCEFIGALFSEKFLKDFIDREFAQDIFIELLPAWRNGPGHRRKIDARGHDAPEIQVWMENLLR